MTDNITPVDLSLFHLNRMRYPLEELERYSGQHVAWNPEGTQILAAGQSLDEVDGKLAQQGIHHSQVVHDYIDPPHHSRL